MLKYTIELKSWDDGCCYDYGLELIVNGKSISKHFDPSNGLFSELLQELELLDNCGVDSKVINIDERS